MVYSPPSRSAELAAIFGVSNSLVSRWTKAHRPIFLKGPDGTFDLPRIVEWFVDLRLSEAHVEWDRTYASRVGENGLSPSDQKRLLEVQRLTMDLEERARTLVRTEDVKEIFELAAGSIRIASEVLQTHFGAEAHRILQDAIDDAERAFHERFNA